MKRETRIAGALMGFAAGDALGATTEFMTPEKIRKHYRRHRNITGGGTLGWRAGQGTDDSDLMFRLARVYCTGYSPEAVAESWLEWLESNPKDVGGTTNAGLKHYGETRDAWGSGVAVMTKMSAGNGSLMSCLPTGLAVRDAGERALRATDVSCITHADPRCVHACVAYTHIVAQLLDGEDARDAVWETSRYFEWDSEIATILQRAPMMRFKELSFSGYVLDTLTVAVWAVCQERSLENLLIDIVNQGDDADTTAAVAGGLLGARDGVQAVPRRWVQKLEYAAEALDLGGKLGRL